MVTNKGPIVITNIYVPPASGAGQVPARIDLSAIFRGEPSLVAGDFNGHVTVIFPTPITNRNQYQPTNPNHPAPGTLLVDMWTHPIDASDWTNSWLIL